jgi:hypothetical protein
MSEHQKDSSGRNQPTALFIEIAIRAKVEKASIFQERGDACSA